jgi:hypothetical protein
VPLIGGVAGFFIVVPLRRELPSRLRFIWTRLRSMDRPSVFRAAHVDRLVLPNANRARANLFRYSASASRVSTKSNRFDASSSKKVRRAACAHPSATKNRRDIAVAAADEDALNGVQRR